MNLKFIGIVCLLSIFCPKALTSEEVLLKPYLKIDKDLIKEAKSIDWKEKSKPWERKVTLLGRLEITTLLFDPLSDLAKFYSILKEEYEEEEIDNLFPKRVEELKKMVRISVVSVVKVDYGADIQFDWGNCFLLSDDKGKKYQPLAVSQGAVEYELAHDKMSREITVTFPSLYEILKRDTQFIKLIITIPAGKTEFYWKFDPEYLKSQLEE